MNKNKWELLSDDEIYILKRMAIESMWNIFQDEAISKQYLDAHKYRAQKLINELIEEDGRRQYNK